jgi:hypothetical protein
MSFPFSVELRDIPVSPKAFRHRQNHRRHPEQEDFPAPGHYDCA